LFTINYKNLQVYTLSPPPISTALILVPRGCTPFGQHQEQQPLAWPDFLSIYRVFVSYSQPIRFVRFDAKSVNWGLQVLGRPRGCDSWYYPKRAWPLGTRMQSLLFRKVNSYKYVWLCEQDGRQSIFSLTIGRQKEQTRFIFN